MIGENIRAARQRKNMTQDQLAQAMHVVRQTISKWEKNISVPDVQSLQELSKVLDVSVEVLLGDGTEQNEEQAKIAQQLASISEELAAKNRRGDRMWTWFEHVTTSVWERLCLIVHRLWWLIVILLVIQILMNLFGGNMGASNTLQMY